MTGAKRLAASCAAVGTTLLALTSSSMSAEQPHFEGCRAASKIEYDSAKRDYLLRNKYGAYVRTGHIWRRYYWYCHQ
jgi:hypothetical protein